MQTIKKTIILDNLDLAEVLSGNEKFFDLFETRFDSTIVLRGNSLIIKGARKEIEMIDKIITEINFLMNKNGDISEQEMSTVFDVVTMDEQQSEDSPIGIRPANSDIIYHGYKDKIRLKNDRQKEYHKKVLDNDIVFSIGPAGTGKTFLAVAMALDALKRNEISRIILTRPAVEAGESLGFLPGDLNEKLDPYLRPLMDALQFMVSPEKLKSLKERNIIEINPLAYMRGRTLNNAFVILDEAQNTTTSQMKMFLTRLGMGSKAIITGDVTQIDLPNKSISGLKDAKRLLGKINGIEFLEFEKKHVVRHRLVSAIIKAYEDEEARSSKKS